MRGTGNSSRPAGTGAVTTAAALTLVCIALIPVMLVEIPPLVDYPNHMARMYILADKGHSPWLRHYYEIHWNILPNLAMDLVVPPLIRVLSIETAGKVFIGMTFALLIGGTIALHVALHRRWSPWPLLACFFLYNSVFRWGFLNYLFGLGLAFLACALWILLRDRSAIPVLAVFSFVTTGLFFAHLFAFGVFFLFAVSYEFGRTWLQYRHGATLARLSFWKPLPLALLPLILLVLSPTFKSGPDQQPQWLRGVPPRPVMTFVTPAAKLEALKGTLRTDHPWLDRVTAITLVIIVGVGVRLQRLRLHPSMLLPLAVMTLAALVMPSTIGNTGLVEIRMPVVLILLALAGSDWQYDRPGRLMLLPLGLCLLFIVRMASIAEQWRDTDHHYRQFIEALDQLPESARLFSAIKLDSFELSSPVAAVIPDPMPMASLSCWGIIRRSLFISSLFSAPGQQPVHLTPALRSMPTIGEFQARAEPIPWDQIGAYYDYVVVRRGQRLTPPVPTTFTPFGSGDTFQFYRTGRHGP